MNRGLSGDAAFVRDHICDSWDYRFIHSPHVVAESSRGIVV